jgi:hypothetical protein
MSKLKYPNWQRTYEEALLEPDKKKSQAKIRLAEWKIFRRLQTISADSNHHEEKVAMADASDNVLSIHFGNVRTSLSAAPISDRGKPALSLLAGLSCARWFRPDQFLHLACNLD